ncbi:MAG: phosphoadenosine phosphosulfate reductase family protein [Candidatus Hodarchaeota archaeon]
MKHIVAFSGGIASAVVAQIVAAEHHYDTILLFHDTKTEPEDNYRFRREVANFLNIPITERSDGRNIWELFKDEGYLGNARNTPCSRILKQEQSVIFCEHNKPCIIYFGFTPNEYRRAQNTYARYERLGIEAKFPLIERKIIKSKCKEIISKWKYHPPPDIMGFYPENEPFYLSIKIPEMYCHYDHANCMPCIKGKLRYWGLVYNFDRDAWYRARQAEIEHGYTILTDGRTLKEALPDCLRLAAVNDNQETLFELPCECAL